MVMAEKSVTSPYLEGNFAPVREEVTAEDLPVIGELPEGLEGMFVRNGPNPQFDVIKNYHWFGGDGMLHGVRIQNGRVSYRNRYVQTEAYHREKAAGRALWGSGLGRPEFDNPNGPARGNTGNTAFVWHDGRLLALWEAGDPHHIRLPGLETIGTYTYNGRLLHAFTAHPKVDEKTGEMLFFGYHMMGFDLAKQGAKVPYLQYSVVNPQGEIVLTTPIDLPHGVMMHDFAVTQRYSIFMDLPLVFDMQRAMAGESPLHFDKSLPARFGILPRHATGDQVRWFEAPPCYVFHTLNAFEDGDDVVLDACRMAEIDIGSLDSSVAPTPDDRRLIREDVGQVLYRWRFNLATGAVREEPLDDQTSDFPRVNDSLIGYSARFGYTARFGNAGGMPESDAIIKYDLHTGRHWVHHHGKGRYGGEGVFVPRPGATTEDDGYVLAFVYDHTTGGSEFVVINALDLEARPLARVPLPQRVPYGFHGAWISEDRIQAQR
jgi:carotenoid cleavage dioxygenase